MKTLLVLSGILFTLIGLFDIFMTILYYEGSSRLSNWLQRSVWLFIRRSGLFLSHKLRYALYSFAAPLLISITLISWISIEIFGFGLIYMAGMVDGNDNFRGGADLHPLLRGMYLSSVTLPTLGFGDIIPITWFYQMAAAVEALLGFALMTLSLSYILNIYRVIQQFRVLAAELFHETADTGDAMVLIRHHWDSRLPLYIDSYFRHIEYMLLDWYENLHQYPIAYYYFSSRTHLSIPFAFKTLGTTISAHYFGTPPTKVFISSPALQSLYNSYCSIVTSLLQYFVHQRVTTSAPVEFEKFKLQITGKEEVSKEIRDFLQLTSIMEGYSGSEREENTEHLYARYCQWSRFEQQMLQFTEHIARDLGYS
ncbi:MAG TPA: potassium channel family protein [Chitinispirillaceae bacterium]|nr:potassium channel family protein [Chitinispirillaceae bacterium]